MFEERGRDALLAAVGEHSVEARRTPSFVRARDAYAVLLVHAVLDARQATAIPVETGLLHATQVAISSLFSLAFSLGIASPIFPKSSLA